MAHTPLADGYYVVIRKDLPEDHSARSVIDWLRSGDGKDMIKGLRFVTAE